MPHRKVKPARESTNARLGTERKKTNDELAARVITTNRQADEVLHAARGRAAGVLRTARERADESAQQGQLSLAEQTAIAEERGSGR